MKLVVPAARLVIECAKGRILTQPLAGLAPSRAHPFGDQLCHVAFEHFTSLRFGKSHGMFEFHALSVYRGSRVSCRVPVLDPLLDLRIDTVKFLHRKAFPFRDDKTKRGKERKPVVDEGMD